MRSFDPTFLSALQLPPAMAWLVGACMEAKGKQDLWAQRTPEVLDVLRELAIVQSAESSNRIEGVIVDRDRLRPLVLGEAEPRDRPEEELVGYRKALNWIHAHYKEIEITPDTILQLHELCQGGFSGDAGRWKSRNNEIIELLPNGERRVRFVPVSAPETPAAMEQLCLAYRDLVTQDGIPRLIPVAALVLDFLCVHPFRDGNGRVSRLLSLLVLRRQGFHVGSYVSLERLIEDNEAAYYGALERSSRRWHQGEHDLLPWLSFFLSTLRAAYGELAERFERMEKAPGGRGELVRRAISRQTGSFTLAQLRALCPTVSVQTVKKILQQLRQTGEVTLEGRGRGARWRKSH